MKYLVWSIIPIAIYVLYYFAMKKSFASHMANMAKEQFIIRPPKMYIVVGTVSSIFFLGFLIYSIVVRSIFAAIGFGLFCVPTFGVL